MGGLEPYKNLKIRFKSGIITIKIDNGGVKYMAKKHSDTYEEIDYINYDETDDTNYDDDIDDLEGY